MWRLLQKVAQCCLKRPKILPKKLLAFQKDLLWTKYARYFSFRRGIKLTGDFGYFLLVASGPKVDESPGHTACALFDRTKGEIYRQDFQSGLTGRR